MFKLLEKNVDRQLRHYKIEWFDTVELSKQCTRIPELKNEIVQGISETEQQLCQNVIENVNKRMRDCGVARDGRLSNIFSFTICI